MATHIERRWINQPSTLQPLHAYHGTNVLAAFNHEGYGAVLYFLEGDVQSICIPKSLNNTLSMGWKS